MIKLMQCIRRKPQLSVAEFRQHWDRYKEAWLELAKLSEARRMVTSIGLDIDLNASIQLARGTREPFDGVLEIWWESGDHVDRCIQNPALQGKLASMRRFQEEFIDLASSSIFFTSEDEHFGGG
jgi:EthD domain